MFPIYQWTTRFIKTTSNVSSVSLYALSTKVKQAYTEKFTLLLLNGNNSFHLSFNYFSLRMDFSRI